MKKLTKQQSQKITGSYSITNGTADSVTGAVNTTTNVKLSAGAVTGAVAVG